MSWPLLYPCIVYNCSKNYGQHLNVPSMKISFTWLQSTRRFEVQDKIMICESTSFTKHISSDLDVLTVIVLSASWTSIIHFGKVGCLFLDCLYIASDRLFMSLSVKCCSSPVWSSLCISFDGLSAMSLFAFLLTETRMCCLSTFLASVSWLCSVFADISNLGCSQPSFTRFESTPPRYVATL
jgi:hypothetical protein